MNKKAGSQCNRVTGAYFLTAAEKWVKKNRILIVFIIYLIVTLVAVIFHENWEDEAQAWLTARELNPIELIGRMSTEGHFVPWYLILMPFAKLGFPYKTMNIISWLITASAAWLMLKHLPCKFYKRVVFIFTLPMIYLYPVVSRCYCLLPLGVILAIMFYKDRFERPLRYLFSILLIANVHTYTFGFALMMGLEFLVDWLKRRKKLGKRQNKLILYGMIGVISLAALSCLPLLGSLGENGASGMNLKIYNDPLKQFFINTPIQFFLCMFPGEFEVLAYIAISFLIIWEFFVRKREFLKIAFAIIWQCFICCFIFDMILPQRIAITLFVVLFFVSCRHWRDERKMLPTSKWDILSMLMMTIITSWIEINTGNPNLALMAFLSISFLITLPYMRRKPALKEKFYKIGQGAAKTLLLFLAITQVWAGITTIGGEIQRPYTDALATANFINDNIPDNGILLTTQESSMVFTAIVPYLRAQNERFYNVRLKEFYTFTKQLMSTEALADPNDIDWASYCGFGKKVYFVGMSEQYYEDFFDSDQKFTPTTALENTGVLRKVFDIYEGAATNEHYTIYEVDSEICGVSNK